MKIKSFKLFESQFFFNFLKRKNIIYILIIVNIINTIFKKLLINVI